ncbi:unnamed protein product [Closterium sp. NIES-54]
MNAPDRYERFVLPDGMKKVSYERDTKVLNAATLVIQREDHTIGNLLRMQLHRDPHVLFVGYRIPHPLKYEVQFKIQTTSQSSPQQAYNTALTALDGEMLQLKASFQEAVKQCLPSVLQVTCFVLVRTDSQVSPARGPPIAPHFPLLPHPTIMSSAPSPPPADKATPPSSAAPSSAELPPIASPLSTTSPATSAAPQADGQAPRQELHGEKAPAAVAAEAAGGGEVACGKEAVDLLNCVADARTDLSKCTALMGALRRCAARENVKSFSLPTT